MISEDDSYWNVIMILMRIIIIIVIIIIIIIIIIRGYVKMRQIEISYY